MKKTLKHIAAATSNGWKSVLCVGLILGVIGCSKASKVEGHLEKGDALYAFGDYEKARIEYLNVTQLSPTNAHAFAQIGNIFYENGLPLKAGAYLSHALELGDTDPKVLARRAVLLAMIDRAKATEDALKALDQDLAQEEALLLLADLAADDAAAASLKTRVAALRQSNGDQPVYDTTAAVLALRGGDSDEAERLLKGVTTRHPDYAAAPFVLGEIYLSRSNLVDGEAAFARAAELSPPRSNRQMRYIDVLLNRDKDAGKAQITSILKQAPDYVPARLRSAQIAFADTDYDSVKKDIQSIISRDAQNIEARQLEAQMYLALKDADKAQTIMDDLVKLYPNSAQLWYQAALISIAKNDTDRSLVQIDKAFELNPKLPQVVLLRGRLLTLKGRTAEAIQSIQEFVTANPNYAPGHLQLADAMLRNNDLAGALSVYRDYETRFSKDPRGSFMQGTLLLRQQKAAEARAAFERTLVVADNFFPAIEQLALLDLKTEQFDAAAKRVTGYLAANPKSAEAQLLLGGIYVTAKDYPKAEAALEAAITENPQLENAYFLLVQVYNLTGRKAEATRKLEELLTAKPTDVRALMTLAIIRTEEKNYQGAADKYEALIQVNPDLSPALNNLAYLYSEQLNDLNRAYELARKAQQILPADPKVGDTLGWILYRRKDYNQALVHLDASATKLADIGEVQFHLGMAYYQLGNEARALALLQKSLTLKDATGSWAGDAQAALDILALDVSKQDAQVLAQLEKLAKTRPDDVIVITRLGQVQEALGKNDAALASYQKATQLVPSATKPLIGQARLALAKGNTAEVMNLVRKAREVSGNDSAAAFELGRLAYLAKDYQYSYALLQDALKQQASSEDAQFAFAQPAIAIGQLDAAKAALGKVVAAGGKLKDRAALDLKLIAASESRSVADLPADLKSQLVANKSGLLARFVGIRLIAADGNTTGAIADYKKLLADYPQFVPAMKQLSIELIKNPATIGDAEKWARQARETLSSDAELSKVLGESAFSKKDYRYAADVLNSASKTLTDDGNLFLMLAQSQAELKQIALAKTSVSRALALPLSPQGKQTAEALSKSLTESQ